MCISKLPLYKITRWRQWWNACKNFWHHALLKSHEWKLILDVTNPKYLVTKLDVFTYMEKRCEKVQVYSNLTCYALFGKWCVIVSFFKNIVTWYVRYMTRISRDIIGNVLWWIFEKEIIVRNLITFQNVGLHVKTGAFWAYMIKLKIFQIKFWGLWSPNWSRQNSPSLVGEPWNLKNPCFSSL